MDMLDKLEESPMLNRPLEAEKDWDQHQSEPTTETVNVEINVKGLDAATDVAKRLGESVKAIDTAIHKNKLLECAKEYARIEKEHQAVCDEMTSLHIRYESLNNRRESLSGQILEKRRALHRCALDIGSLESTDAND